MKISRTLGGKISLGLILSGQLVMLAGLLAWIQSRSGSAWASRQVVVTLAGGGAGLYFTGRILQMIARRRQDRKSS